MRSINLSWLSFSILLFLFSISSVSAAVHIDYCNLTISNQTVELVTPHTIFQTICGQHLSRSFEVVHHYDQTINTTIIYNYTTINNYTTTSNCSYVNDNCTVNVVYNVSSCNLDNSTNFTKLWARVNATFWQCTYAKRICDDLYTSNITYKVNITGDDIRQDINRTLNNFTTNLMGKLLTDEHVCQSYKDQYEQCRDVTVVNLGKDLELAKKEVKDAERWVLIFGILALLAVAGWVGMFVVQYGKALKGKISTKESDMKE